MIYLLAPSMFRPLFINTLRNSLAKLSAGVVNHEMSTDDNQLLQYETSQLTLLGEHQH